MGCLYTVRGTGAVQQLTSQHDDDLVEYFSCLEVLKDPRLGELETTYIGESWEMWRNVLGYVDFLSQVLKHARRKCQCLENSTNH